MYKSRFEQIYKQKINRDVVPDLIPIMNSNILNEYWEKTLEFAINQLILRNDFSLNRINWLVEKIRILWWVELDKSIPLNQMFTKFLVENVLLPNHTEKWDFQGFYNELRRILKRAELRVENILKREKWFFSIFCPQLEWIYDNFVLKGRLEKIELDIWWIFWKCFIENDPNWEFKFIISVRQKSEDSNQKIIKPDVLKETIKKIFSSDDSWNYIFKETKISISHLQDLKNEYWKNKKDFYKVFEIFIDWKNLDDYEDFWNKEIIDSIFSTWQKLINSLAKVSGIEHKQRIFSFSSKNFVEYLGESNFDWDLNLNLNKIGNNIKNSKNSKKEEKEFARFESLRVEMKEPITLNDVWGQSTAKKEMKNIIKSIKSKEIMDSWWAKTTSGIILEGEPGTGKTLLAKALAYEVEADVYQIKLTDIAPDAYINTWSNNITMLFKFIRKKAELWWKIIVILDELDSLFPKRWLQNSHREDTKIVNSFLTELSGFEKLDNVIFIWTTNLIENIDPAVIRSGRLSTKIKVNLPDSDELKQIYEIHLNKARKKSQKFKNISENLELEKIISYSNWLSGADVEEVIRIIVEEKAMQEIERIEVKNLDFEDFKKAIDKVKRKEKKQIWFIKKF